MRCSAKAVLQKGSIKHHLQHGYACGEDTTVVQVVGGWSQSDARGDIVLCMTQLNLSARAYHRTLRVKLARTIADLAQCEAIQAVHLAEALL